MKRQLLIIALLLMPVSVTWLHAQENKHAQAMYRAFVETLHNKLPKTITAKWNPAKDDSVNVVWNVLDGGGNVPKEKINVVMLSKTKSKVVAAVGPLYLDGHRFHFYNVPDDPTLPLRHILNAFDKQSPYASSYYSYVAGDEQAAFPGISIAFGEEGYPFPLSLDPRMNVRVIGFKDDDGFRSTYLLSWMSWEMNDADRPANANRKLYRVEGIIYEFHCPKLKSTPQVKAYNPDEYLERTNTALSVAQNMYFDMKSKEPERVKALATDTVAEMEQYSFQTMTTKLYNSPENPNLKTSYEALKAKLHRMVELSLTANPTELQVICHTLIKEVNNYPFQYSSWQVEELVRLTDTIASFMPKELKPQVASAQAVITAMRNLTADIDSLSENDQEYLNRNFWNLSHNPVVYTQTHFTGKGEHYSGDSQTGYFEVNANVCDGFHAETSLHDLRPGRYRVSAVVRAGKDEHSGAFIFCTTGNVTNGETHQKEIPAIGNSGGNVWFSALQRFVQRANAHEGVYALDMNKTTVSGGQGYGWNRIYLDDIIVSDGNLTYGVTTRPEITNTQHRGSNWFSACDFIVERVGD